MSKVKNVSEYLDKRVYADGYDGNKDEAVMARIPKKGEQFMFYDDGKPSLSRMYQAKVIKTYTNENVPDFVKKAFQNDANDCDWIYKKDESGNNVTDIFIECSIPKYDDNNIWFVRTVDGGFFSIDIQSNWQSGVLDVDNRITNYIDSLND